MIIFFLLYLFFEDKKINRVGKGNQQLKAFMDDFKIHAPSRKEIDCITKTLSEGGAEVKIVLYTRKCRVFNRVCLTEKEDKEENDIGDEDPCLT